MPLTVNQALQMKIFSKCKLLTGQAGLQNEILWVNILEILDDLSHIEPGEFLITTAHGFNAHSKSRQQEMIELFAAKNLAAMAIQTGHYLQLIPPSFIQFAEIHNIPLIEIPPEVSFKSLTRASVKPRRPGLFKKKREHTNKPYCHEKNLAADNGNGKSGRFLSRSGKISH